MASNAEQRTSEMIRVTDGVYYLWPQRSYIVEPPTEHFPPALVLSQEPTEPLAIPAEPLPSAPVLSQEDAQLLEMLKTHSRKSDAAMLSQNSENQFDRERGEDQEPQSSLVQKQRMHRFPEAQAPVFQPALYPAYQPAQTERRLLRKEERSHKRARPEDFALQAGQPVWESKPKPPFEYPGLCALVLSTVEQAPVVQLYRIVEAFFPFFVREKSKSWQKSFRHALSTHKDVFHLTRGHCGTWKFCPTGISSVESKLNKTLTSRKAEIVLSMRDSQKLPRLLEQYRRRCCETSFDLESPELSI